MITMPTAVLPTQMIHLEIIQLEGMFVCTQHLKTVTISITRMLPTQASYACSWQLRCLPAFLASTKF